jgi:membrane protease subunit (stomatin/prohibitin family)
MGLWNRVKGQLRSVIEWKAPEPDALYEKWSDHGDEIKDASTLIIGPGQGCIFVYEGRVEAIIMEEGIKELKTENVPFWTTISNFMQRFESEHKVGIYYFRTTKILDQKWGTPSVVKYEDPKYKFPVGLRAFGNYSFRITDPGSFFVNVIGGDNIYRISDFKKVMGARLIHPLADLLAESQFTYAEIDANREEISAGMEKKLKEEFEDFGFEFLDFRIEGTSFDDDTMRRINRIADMSAEAQAASAAGLNYAQMQQLEAMRDLAQNEGTAGAGVGLGAGMGAGVGFGQMMSNAFGGASAGTSGGQQPSQTADPNDPMVKLQKLKQMLDSGLITQDEYDSKKKDILASM